MTMIKHPKGEYSMDGYLSINLETAKRVIRKDWDMIFAIDGPEGSGKSVMAQQLAYDCDTDFSIERIVFDPDSFRKAVITAKPYQAIIYDEAYTGLSSRATMSFINRALISMLAEIRQKNLFIFVVMPSFFDLDKYVALWRSRALIHVYIGDNFERGFFAFYNTERKKDLYILGKKFYSYAQPRPNFSGRFPNFYVIDETEYKKRKKDSLINREKKSLDTQIKRELDNELFIRLQNIEKVIPHSLKIEILGMPPATYFRKLKQYNEMRELS